MPKNRQPARPSSWGASWINRLGGTLILLTLTTTPLGAQQIIRGTVTQGTGNSGASPWNVQFFAPQHIVCDSGCGSPPAVPDSAAFTFGLTTVSPIAWVVDDVAPNAVAENSYGAARMSASRVMLFALTDDTGARATFTGTSLNINCTAGCGGAAAFADNSAFTFNTTSVGNTSYVVDDVGTNNVTENSAGTPRMSAARLAYADLSKSASNTNSFKVDFGGAAQPVSGTVTVTDGAGALNVIVDSGTTTVTQGTATNLNAAVVGTGTAGAPAGNILTVQGVAAMTKLLVTPDSVALPANQSVNVAQVAGTNTVTGGVAGIIAVGGNVANAVAATANPVPVGGIFTTTPATLASGQTGTMQFTAAQNIKHDVTTIAGTAPTTAGKLDVKGADGDVFVRQATATNLNAAVVGTGTAGTPAGNILTVQGVASMTKLLVTPDSVALPANQSVNVAQIAGTNTVTGGVAGIIAVGGNVANAVAATANPVPVGGIFTTTPATLTTGQTATAQYTAAQNLKTDLATIAGTAPTTVGKIDVKGADGDVFVRQATAANLNATVTQLAITKGTQAATGVSTQDLHDAGRTAISFYANNFASGATTVEKIITWDQSKGTGAITAATASYTITNGKTLRITELSVGTRGHLTATAQTTTFALRLNTAGACVVTSTPILFAAQSATAAVSLAWDRVILPIPEGYEIAGNGTIALCMTGNSTFTTNAPTWAVNLVGYEY